MASGNEAVIPSAIQQSTIEALRIQVGVTAEIVSASLEAAEIGKKSGHECMSVLGMKSSSMAGSIALAFPSSTFLAMLEKMIGEKHAEVTTLNADAGSELLNIIYASARVKINDAGFDFQPAIPTTICGKDLSLALGNSAKYLRFNCRCECGDFIVALNLKKETTKG